MAKPTKSKNVVSHTSTAPLESTSGASKSRYILMAVMVALFLLTRFAYQNALDNQFVTWDDPMYVTENPMLTQYGKPNAPTIWKTPIALNYHPLTMQTLVWNAQNLGKKAETEARPFISTNILLHGLNVVLLFIFLWLLTEGSWFVALSGSLMFAVHPMHVESVAWISERKDVLYGFFFLGALITYLRFLTTAQKMWLGATIGLFLLSCLSKAMAVSLVPVLFLIDWYKGRNLKDMKIWIEKTPLFIIALVIGFIALDIQKGGNFNGMFNNIEGVKSAISSQSAFSFLDKLAFASYGMLQYMIKFFLPFNLSAYYPYPVEALNNQPIPSVYYFYILGFIAIIGLAIWSLKIGKEIAFGLGFYLATVLLVSQFLSVGTVIMADRYTYLPYIGFSLSFLLLVDRWIKDKTNLKYIAYGIVAVLTIFWLTLTTKQVDDWQNTETLFSKANQLYPENQDILNILGLYYGKSGKLAEAKACFEQAINGKYPIKHATIYEGLGNIYGMSNNPQQAVAMFSKAIEIEPTRGSFYFNRAVAYATFDPNAALADLDKALPLMPLKDKDKVVLQRGACFLQLKDYTKVIANAENAIKQGISTEYIYYQMGIAKFNLGDRVGAIQNLDQALKINPNFAEAKNILAQIK
jgi:protein O-mannosyl-transferase